MSSEPDTGPRGALPLGVGAHPSRCTNPGPSIAASGIMRGVTDPEIKPVSSLPWYRALVTRTPRGRKLRWRLFVALLLPWSLSWDPRGTLARFGLWHWDEPTPPRLTPAEKTEVARREAERYYRGLGCERAGETWETWICPNPDAGITVAECRMRLMRIHDAGNGPPGEIKCVAP